MYVGEGDKNKERRGSDGERGPNDSIFSWFGITGDADATDVYGVANNNQRQRASMLNTPLIDGSNRSHSQR
jgi:hypothetical protein